MTFWTFMALQNVLTCKVQTDMQQGCEICGNILDHQK